MTSRVSATGLMAHFGGDANWATLENRGGIVEAEFGDATSIEVGMSQFLIGTVAKTLVPEDASRVGSEAMNIVDGESVRLRCG